MELAVAHTVYNLAVGITNFIAEHDDKDAGREQISNIVVLIQNVIHPLLSHKITNTPLEKCLEGLQSVLTKTHQHMKMWKESRSHRLLAFINPSAVIQQLKEDREQLMDQYIMLMGAMQVIEHIKGYDPITPPTVHPSTVPKGKTKKVEGQASEVLDFWEKCIGSEVFRLNPFFFMVALWAYVFFSKKTVWVSEKRLLLQTTSVMARDKTQRGRYSKITPLLGHE